MSSGYAAAVEGRHKAHMAKIEFVGAAQVHAVRLAAVFSGKPGSNALPIWSKCAWLTRMYSTFSPFKASVSPSLNCGQLSRYGSKMMLCPSWLNIKQAWLIYLKVVDIKIISFLCNCFYYNITAPVIVNSLQQ